MIQFLSNLKLTLGQWLAIIAASTIAVLVALLKLEGSRLHKAQVQLLDTKLSRKEDEDTANVAKAKDTYQNALKTYLKAGGTLCLLLWVLGATPALAEPPSPILAACRGALTSCDTLVQAQGSQIVDLQDAVRQWKKQAGVGTNRHSLTFMGGPDYRSYPLETMFTVLYGYRVKDDLGLTVGVQGSNIGVRGVLFGFTYYFGGGW